MSDPPTASIPRNDALPEESAQMQQVDYPRLAQALEKIVPDGRIATDRLRRLSYGTDASFYRLCLKSSSPSRAKPK